MTSEAMKCANVHKGVFLDRDGTLIEDRGHLGDPSQVMFFPDTIDALRRLQEHFLLFIVTNQPGVSEGIVCASVANCCQVQRNYWIQIKLCSRSLTFHFEAQPYVPNTIIHRKLHRH